MATDMQGGQGATTVSTPEILEGLNDLLQLDHDAIAAYEVAIEKLQDQDYASQIRGYKLDHERHVRDLNEMILQLGGSPANEPHMTGPFKQAMQSLGAIAGDKGTLLAWRTNELQVRTKYDSYAAKANHWPQPVKQLIDRNALDEERHYQWVADTLQRMGVGSGEGMETDAANRMREQAASAARRAEQMTGQARDRMGAMLESTRMHLADSLETAAERLDQMASKQESTGGRQAQVAAPAHQVAGGMEAAADYLRSADAEQLRHDLEEQVREKPIRTLAMTLAVGFVIGRILR